MLIVFFSVSFFYSVSFSSISVSFFYAVSFFPSFSPSFSFSRPFSFPSAFLVYATFPFAAFSIVARIILLWALHSPRGVE